MQKYGILITFCYTLLTLVDYLLDFGGFGNLSATSRLASNPWLSFCYGFGIKMELTIKIKKSWETINIGTGFHGNIFLTSEQRFTNIPQFKDLPWPMTHVINETKRGWAAGVSSFTERPSADVKQPGWTCRNLSANIYLKPKLKWRATHQAL